MTNKALQDFPKEEYQDMLETAVESGVHIVHYRIGRTGGATIAWRRASDFPGTRMVEVAFSFCSPRDTFVRRLGTLQALTNYFEGSTVHMPIGSKNSEEINNAVRRLAYVALSATTAYQDCI